MYQLYHGDCLDILPTLAPQSVDAVITSPPYNIGKQYGAYDDTRDDYLSFLQAVLEQVKRISKCLWINVGYRKLPQGNIPIAYQIWDKTNMYFVQSVKWEYGAGMTYKKRFNHRSEDWLWFAQDENYTFNPDAVRDISLTKYKNDRRNNPNGKLPGDVWYFPHVAGTFKERKAHPAQYPIGMIERIILASTNPGDTVLDPFMGSGTTGAACGNLGRRFVGIEKDLTYFALGRDRIANAYAPLGAMQQEDI